MKEVVINKIKTQQAKFEETELEYGIADKLIKIAESSDFSAEIIGQDLDVEEMGLTACGKALTEYAKKEKKGSSFAMTDALAERLIKEFYKIPSEEQPSQLKSAINIGHIDLLEGVL